MIIKSLTRSAKSGSGGIGQLFRYVLREKRNKRTAAISRVGIYLTSLPSDRPCYVAGVRLSKEDVKYLIYEARDAKLLAELRAFQGSVKEFIEQRLLSSSISIDKDKSAEKITIVLKHNVSSITSQGMIDEFEDNENNRIVKRVDRTLINHAILSWNSIDREHITDAMLQDMARKFVSLRGENNKYCFVKHEDRDAIHMHCLLSGTSLNGKSSRISRNDFAYLKEEMDRYQKERYGMLSNSLPEHGKSKCKQALISKPYKRDERTLVKHTLLESIETAYSRSHNKDHFLQQVRDMGYEVYLRNGDIQGVMAEGLKFRFSRLGFDIDRINDLDKRLVQKSMLLAELAHIRTRSKEIERSNQNEERFKNIGVGKPYSEAKEVHQNGVSETLNETPGNDEKMNQEQDDTFSDKGQNTYDEMDIGD